MAETRCFLFIKIVQTKHVIEVYEYEHLNVNSQFPEDRADYGESLNAIENYKKRNQLRRDNIRRLAIENFDTKNDKFLTLTFRDNPNLDVKDVKACNEQFKMFIKRLKRYIKKHHDQNHLLKYLAVIEFQDKNGRGAVHYHMLLNMPFIHQKNIEDLWGLGFIFINKIDHVDNLGAYVIKYMTPDTEDERLKGLKAYNCSKNLDRPKLLRSWEWSETEKVQAMLKSLPKEKVVYSAKYRTEQSGKIAYSQVNLTRKLPK